MGNISKDWSEDNMKDTGLNGYVYDFNVVYDATSVDDIKDIYKHLMKKSVNTSNVIKCLSCKLLDIIYNGNNKTN